MYNLNPNQPLLMLSVNTCIIINLVQGMKELIYKNDYLHIF